MKSEESPTGNAQYDQRGLLFNVGDKLISPKQITKLLNLCGIPDCLKISILLLPRGRRFSFP